MKLTVCGATGGTGREVVRQALEAGHEVTAVVRGPARLPDGLGGVRVVTADVTDPQSLRPAIEGRDAVISALGPRSRKHARDGVVAPATRGILSALEICGVRRLVAVSAAPVGPSPQGDPFLDREIMTPLIRRVLRDVYTDLGAMEEAIRGSDTEWTVIRPPRLLDKPLTGTYRLAVGGNVPGGRTIARSDLAHAILAVLDDPATAGQVVGVAY
ncbi:NAD(P)-dependent oxidoreductase [Streptosporangium sp. NPDC002721]|uniref:NAD(P)-dependent oxidoreductase n=1 Tax=Streptosporangium sp. NPDC002721 TaxID=3366188 RepID=UPI0036D04086